MKIIKGVYIMLIIASLLMGVTGCMSMEKYSEDVKNEMLVYLAEKYNEKFVIKDFIPSGNGFNRPVYDEAYVYSESDPAREFRVQRRKEEDSDKYVLRDGYLLRQAEDLLKAKMSDVGNRFFGKCKVELIVETIGHVTYEKHNKQIELDDFIKRETALDIGIDFYISYSGSFDIDEQADKVYAFMNEMLANKYHGNIYFVFVDDQYYDQIKAPKFNDLDLDEMHKIYGIKYVTRSEILNYEPYKDTKADIIERFNKYYQSFEDYDKKTKSDS